MNEALLKAQHSRAMQTINSFAPTYKAPQRAISRKDMQDAILDNTNRVTLSNTTQDELATIYAALVSAKNRSI
jgi:hypothetical protein